MTDAVEGVVWTDLNMGFMFSPITLLGQNGNLYDRPPNPKVCFGAIGALGGAR